MSAARTPVERITVEHLDSRITVEHLRGMLERIAREAGTPPGPIWTRRADGSNCAKVGALFIENGFWTRSGQYGYPWKVCQIVNEGGGEKILLQGMTARDLYEAMQAFALGLEWAEQQLRG